MRAREFVLLQTVLTIHDQEIVGLGGLRRFRSLGSRVRLQGFKFGFGQKRPDVGFDSDNLLEKMLKTSEKVRRGSSEGVDKNGAKCNVEFRAYN